MLKESLPVQNKIPHLTKYDKMHFIDLNVKQY